MEAINDLFEKRLQEYLDDQFEEYRTEDDYYQPVVEDYGINLEYDLKKRCEENRFKFVSAEDVGSVKNDAKKLNFIEEIRLFVVA